jgi:cell division septation protein DedD
MHQKQQLVGTLGEAPLPERPISSNPQSSKPDRTKGKDKIVLSWGQIIMLLCLGIAMEFSATVAFAFVAGEPAQLTSLKNGAKKILEIFDIRTAQAAGKESATVVGSKEPRVPDTNVQKNRVQVEASSEPIFAVPQPGRTYLQVSAVPQNAARAVVDALRTHGFRSFVAPGPNSTLHRVLVGPLNTEAEVREAKANLVSLRHSPFVRQYPIR